MPARQLIDGVDRRALNGADSQVLARLVAKQNDATLVQYGARMCVQASAAALCRALARPGLRRKGKRFTRASRTARR